MRCSNCACTIAENPFGVCALGAAAAVALARSAQARGARKYRTPCLA
ncbi:MAG: hypothetical protein ABIR54_01320 [Burkholderiaceae bacterium]|jgi:hypothetical protein